MEKIGCDKCSRWINGIQTNSTLSFNESKDKKIYIKISMSKGGNKPSSMIFESCSRDNKVNKAILDNITFCPWCGMDLTKDLEC